MRFTFEVPDWARAVVSDLTDMDRAPQPVNAKTVRRVTLPLPDDAYFEYGFVDADGRVRADPVHERRAANPWYPELSAVHGPDYRPDPLHDPGPEPDGGTSERLFIPDDAGGEHGRRVVLWTPPGLEGPAPLLLAHDGTAYRRIARLPALLARLAERGEIRPVRAAFVDPIAPEQREAEYGHHEPYLAWARRSLLPRLQERADASETYLIGASLGGLAATRLAWSLGAEVAGLALQSAALLGTPDDPDFHRSTRSWFLQALQESGDALPWRVHQQVGRFDWLHDVNEQAAERLADRSDEHRFAVRSAGHNWTFWRDGLPEALRFLLRP